MNIRSWTVGAGAALTAASLLMGPVALAQQPPVTIPVILPLTGVLASGWVMFEMHADTEVLAGEHLSDHKGVALPGAVIPHPALTRKDHDDLAFALRLGVDWVALSFVQRAADMAELRRLVRGRAAVMAKVGDAIDRLNQMREEEGRGIVRELRQRMAHLQKAAGSVQQHRRAVLHNYTDRLQSRLQELLGSTVDRDRMLQEAALLVDRSDIQEEIVRLENHVQHFLGLMDESGEIGKKLDFLLQEMNREANTLLSKTSGLAGEALNITEAGLAMKAEIEKSREQVQNLE